MNVTLRLVWLGAITIVAALLTQACSPGNGREVLVDESYNGKEVQVALGDCLRLELNTRPPDYGWNITNAGAESILRHDGTEISDPEVNTDETNCTCGPPKTGVWVFRAVGEGTTEIVMDYGQVQSTAKRLKEFRLKLVVN